MTEIKANERVQVVVRCRPMNVKEIKEGFSNVVEVLPSNNAIQIFNPKESDECKTFTFDAVYGCNTTQDHLYKESVQPVINSVLNGFNGTIFAYGQTGAGKTFTMEGNHLDPSPTGVIPKTFEQIFNHISQSKNIQYLVRASYIEIYQEEIKDLLSENSNVSHELLGDGSGIYIKDLTSHICKCVQEMADVMKHGKCNRKVGATDMNQHSSRSHAIFIITIEMSQTISGINHVKVGKLNLVDLAGSERQSKTCTTDLRLKEASKINLSLSALGNVISALSNGKNFHVPYRDSKLTRLLQDSLGGNSKTLMIANIGPASYNYNESLTTLRYANRAKNIKNKPIINEDPKDALIHQYQNEIKRLKDLVQSKRKLDAKPTKRLKGINDLEYNQNNGVDDISEKYQIPLRNASFSDDLKLKQLINIKENEQKSQLIQETSHNIEILENRIQSMESRILRGTDIVYHTNKQQQVIQQQAEEIEEKRRQKMELEQQLEKEEETTEELQDSHTTLEQDIERKTKKLNKLFSKIQQIKMQTLDTTEEFNNDRNDLELAQNELLKEYKLNQIIIDNFIPVCDQDSFKTKIHYEDETEEWKIDHSFKSSNERLLATHYQRRPESEYSRILGKLNYSSRFKGENIINLEIEHQEQSRSRHRIPGIPSTVKYAMTKALKTEDDLTVDASTIRINNSMKYEYERKSSSHSVSNEFFNSNNNTNNRYPKVRGLVKRK